MIPLNKKILAKILLSIDLLEPIFRKGKRVYEIPSLDEIRQRTLKELSKFHVGIKRFMNPHQYAVGMEKSLYDLKIDLIKKIRSQTSHDFYGY